jgi:hypothetical protein
MKKRALAGFFAICALAAGVAPALGESDGTVAAQVTVAAPCIQVTPAQLDFGTLAFSQDNLNVVSAARPVTVTNCGAAATLLGRGSNATSTGGTTWALAFDGESLCPSANNYVERVDTGATSIPLSNQSKLLRQLAAGAAASVSAIVVMPCVGSGGAGQVMTFSYVFTAALG